MTTPTSPLRRPGSLFSLERMRSDKRVTWLTIAGILLVPLVIGGLLVWALWNPTERLHDVKAAVVNLDQPVKLNGQTVPLGRQMAAGLLDTKNDNFSWVLTDKKDADKGIASGEYVSVVTIPENFSKAATSTAGDASQATQATIDVRTSKDSKLVDPAISQAVTTTATSVLNKQLTSTYIENVYVGFNTLGEQLGKAATGADQLSGGLTQLASGTHQLGDGAAQLSSGASSLAGGISQLSDGTSGLADGIQKTADGAAALPGALRGLSGNAGTAATEVTQALQAIGGTAASACAGLDPALDPKLAQLCGTIQAQSPKLQDGIKNATIAQIGVGKVADSSDQLVGGLNGLASGAQQLASGASQSADGAQQLATGVQQLSDGIPALASGADQSASGAASLATGLHTAVKQLPSYDSGERTSLAKVAAEPVTQKASGTTAFGSSSIPLFASVALWLGALATFLVLQALSRRALLTSRAAGLIALDGFVPAAVLGVLQGVLVSAVMAPALGLDVGHWFGFAALASATGIAFAAVNHGLVALLGGVGRFLSMLVVVITLASGIVSTAPDFFDAALPWLPTAPAITALQGAIDGSADAWRGLGALLLWAALGFALALIAVARRRVINAAQLLPAE